MDNITIVVLGISLIIIMWGLGLSLTIDDFKRVVKYPKAIAIGLVNQIILLPIVAFIIVSLFDVSADVAIGIMILAACPGGATSNIICHLAKGDTALSVSLTAVCSLISVISIPFVVNFALLSFLQENQMIQLDIVKTISQIFIVVIIPVGIGVLIRQYLPQFANKMEKPMRLASSLVFILVVVGILIKEWVHLGDYFQQAGIVSMCLNLSTMSLGFFSARLFKLSTKQSLSISIESGIQNGTMALMIATAILGNSAFAVAPAIYSVLMYFSAGFVIYLGSKKLLLSSNEQH